MAQPEHALQVKLSQWTRENVPQPYFFTAIDRSRKQSAMQHVREKARGLVAGTPDCVLILPRLPAMWVELKAPGGRPSEAQALVGAAIQTAGHKWGWCNSVVGYAEMLKRWGVPLSPIAILNAVHKDAILTSASIRREESKTGAPSKKRAFRPRAPKPSARALAAAQRANDLWK